MHDIPEEAVKAAVDAVDEGVNWVAGLFGENYDSAEEVMRCALTAALPFLPALEPSAGRAAVLEEAARVVDAKAEEYEKEARDLRGSDSDRRFCSAVAVRLRGSANEIRALHPVANKPDEAGAQGEGWPTGEYEVDYEIICNGEWVAGSTDLADAKHYAAVYGQDGPVEIVEARTYRRTLPTPPSSEVA